eukprot:Lankesteria_metandrocarpae@DN5604_c0_g1_i1.p1
MLQDCTSVQLVAASAQNRQKRQQGAVEDSLLEYQATVLDSFIAQQNTVKESLTVEASGRLSLLKSAAMPKRRVERLETNPSRPKRAAPTAACNEKNQDNRHAPVQMDTLVSRVPFCTASDLIALE